MKNRIEKVTVFCGSSSGTKRIFEEKAFQLGKYLAEKEIGIVYGGAKVGLMGAVADGSLTNGGNVIGVLPNFLSKKEIAHKNLTKLILVETMHERKTKMNELSDGVIALPGGFGTLEEFFEMLTWAQIGLHKKPIAILNINGFYDDLISFIQKMVDQGFLKMVNRQMLLISTNIEEMLDKMNSYIAPSVEKWISKDDRIIK